MKIQQGTNIPPYPHIDGKTYEFPCYAEVKLDGEANVYAQGQLMSKASGKIRTCCPITQLLRQFIPDDVILFGELHWENGRAGALYDFLSHAKSDDLNFTIFDVYYPHKDSQSYEERREWIIKHILSNDVWKAQSNKYTGSVRVTRPIYLQSQAELDKLITDNKDTGWEGIVIKGKLSLLYTNTAGILPQQHWVKIKHKTTGDYEVAQIDPTLERMDVMIPMGNGNRRLCGVKLVHKYKPYVKVGDVVEITHMGVLSSGGLRHPNFAGKVVKSA